MPAASLVPVPRRRLSVKSGGGVLTPVNDKPGVFSRVEPFRCKPLHFSSHTQPHSFGPRGHSKAGTRLGGDNRAAEPRFSEELLLLLLKRRPPRREDALAPLRWRKRPREKGMNE